MSPIPDIDSPIVAESPSHYGAPDVPMAILALFDTVACMSQVSALSSVLLSPNRVSEDCTSMTANVFPIYQVSLDTIGYQPTTSAVTPPIPEPPGATGSFDSIIGLDLLDQETDFSCLSAPLLVLPDDLLLIPVLDSRSTSPVHQPPRRPPASVVSFPREFSREGPFDEYCTPSNTGSHPLISEGLPGCHPLISEGLPRCPYWMTSYSEQDIVDTNPAYGVQLHHPRSWNVSGGSRVSPFVGSGHGDWVRIITRQDIMAAAMMLA